VTTSVPPFDQFIEPLLRCLQRSGGPVRIADVYEAVADEVGLTDELRGLLLPSGRQPVYKNRIGWAHDRLKRAGFSSSPARGYWELTPSGRGFAGRHPTIPKERLRELAHASDGAEGGATTEAPAIVSDAPLSPDDRIDAAHAELNQRVSADLLEQIMRATPTFFERLVLELLHAMGYGTSRGDLHQTGKSGDGGIDGIISLDKLGFDKVYVQAKRWQPGSNVGRPDVQAFFGALAGKRARKGVFITTSSFSREAKEFVSSVSDSIVLVDGARLAELMIDHGVGVSLTRTLRIVEIDNDFFDEG
jgi:restriction system protein